MLSGCNKNEIKENHIIHMLIHCGDRAVLTVKPQQFYLTLLNVVLEQTQS